MKRTNRIVPFNNNPNQLTYAVMTITTQMEVIRRVEVTPINERMTRLHPHVNQSLPITIERSRTTLWFINCLFMTAGILAFSVIITGLIIAFGKTDAIRANHIERYDLGDLQYGLTPIHPMNLPSNTYLSNMNKIFLEKYFSDQLINQSGYRGLIIDEVFVRKQPNLSCWINFIIPNIQVYFDQCSTCTSERNLVLQRLLFNITAFRQPLHLIVNNVNVYAQFCSTPNLFRPILPVRLNISYIKKINSNVPNITSNIKSISLGLNTTSQVPVKKSVDSTTVVSTNSFETTTDSTSTSNPIETTDHVSTITQFHSSQSINSFKNITQSTTLVTNHRPTNVTTKRSFQTTTFSTFQFLPFRPSMTDFSRRNILFKRSIKRHYDSYRQRHTAYRQS